jgi:tetratricopeptide (TPR) repeat protein
MHGRLAVVLAAVAALVATAAPRAIFIQMETRKVPVSRLAANLEAKLALDPKNVETHINLARLYGMAFALRSSEVPAATIGAAEQPWYGHAPRHIPYESEPLSDKARETAAHEHLKKSREYYERALALDPNSSLAMLGYGWALEQEGKKAQAIEQYRKVVAKAWPKERNLKTRGLGSLFSHEAAGYLIPLLDPARDAAEIAELRQMQVQLDRIPRMVTPIAIPLGSNLEADAVPDASAIVRFDADGSGVPREWSWISRDAGWLVYDADASGEITSALQWFGSASFWLFWNNGYEALAALDDNGDGELTGFELAHLAIWHDANQNGISERGEVRAVVRHGIEAISCRFNAGDGVVFAAVSPEGVRLRGGRVLPTYDVILRQKRSASTKP